MRVLIFAPHFAEYSIRYANALAQYCETKIIVNGKSYSRQLSGLDISWNPNLEIEKILLDSNFDRYANLLAVQSSIERYRPDVVHIQEVPHPICAYLVRVLRAKCKTVLTVHDPSPHSGEDARLSLIKKWSTNYARSNADMLVVHGFYCHEALRAIRGLSSKNIVESQHGAILVPSKEQLRRPEAGRILFFGRMHAYKGLDTLASAAAILHARGTQFRLHLAGTGPELDRLSSQFDLIPGTIVDNTFLAPSAVVEAMQAAEVIVLPYRDATQSGVLAAAFANGRPVVATNVGGIPELVEEGVNGHLVNPNDPKSLADGLEAVISSSEIAMRLAEGARKSGLANFDWNKIAFEMKLHYLSVITAGDAVDEPSGREPPRGFSGE